eukprot:Stramenopile-MAST_4_protein_4380
MAGTSNNAPLQQQPPAAGAPVQQHPGFQGAPVQIPAGASYAPYMVSPVNAMMPAGGPGTGFHKSLSLYVGDLHPDVNEAVLFEHFSKVSVVVSIRVCRNIQTRRSMGYGYVNFQSQADAEKALEELNYSSIRGRPCRIMWSNRNPGLRKSNESNIFIKNLDESIDNKQLHDTFSIFGEILSCKVATDRSGRPKGFGFVHYADEKSADEAIKRVNGMKINDKEVYVSKFEKQKRKTLEWTNLYVKNIPEGWDGDKLKEIFKEFGVVTSVIIKAVGPEEQELKAKFGFVDMETHEEALAAIEGLNGKYELPADAVIIEPLKKDNGEVDTSKAKTDDTPSQAANEDAGADKALAGEDAAEQPADEEEGSGKRYLIVSRAQRKADRERELRERDENRRIERLNKFQGRNLYIKNLADSVTDDLLRKTFHDLGAISSAKVMTDKSNKSRGFGFVCYATTEEADKAVREMNGKVLEGKPLYVSLAQPKGTGQKNFNRKGPRVPGAPRGAQRNMMAMNQMGQMSQMYQMYGMYPQGMMQPGMMNMPGMGRGQPMPMNMPRGGYPGYGQVMMQPPTMMMQQAQPNGGAQASLGPRGGRLNVTTAAEGNAPAAPQPVQQGSQPGPQKLTAAVLAAASPAHQKNMIGEQLYPRIAMITGPTNAGKVTGMLLEAMDTAELLNLLEDKNELQRKTDEAVVVLERHRQDADRTAGGPS